MKKYLIIAASALALLCGCGKTDGNGSDNGGGEEATPVVKLEVTDLKDNCATIKASLTEGQFYGGQIILAEKTSGIEIDYTNEIKLIQYVRANGKTMDNMPYETTVSNLTFEKDYLTAVIVFDQNGRAVSSKYEVWTAEGTPDGISNDNSAGELDNNDIN